MDTIKKFKLSIKDKTGAEVCEGSILGIITTKRKGYRSNGKLIKKKVVFGRANTNNSSLTNYIGFWAVSMDCQNTNFNGEINYYDSVTSVEYLVNSNGAEVMGSIHEKFNKVKGVCKTDY